METIHKEKAEKLREKAIADQFEARRAKNKSSRARKLERRETRLAGVSFPCENYISPGAGVQNLAVFVTHAWLIRSPSRLSSAQFVSCICVMEHEGQFKCSQKGYLIATIFQMDSGEWWCWHFAHSAHSGLACRDFQMRQQSVQASQQQLQSPPSLPRSRFVCDCTMYNSAKEANACLIEGCCMAAFGRAGL